MRSRGLYEENHNGNLHHLRRRDPQDATANLWAGREVAGEGFAASTLAGPVRFRVFRGPTGVLLRKRTEG